MHHRLVHRSPSDLSQTGLTAARLIVAVAMLLGMMTLVPQGAGAQADESAGTYESPSFGYTLEWDADQWTVDGEAEADSNGGRDFLALSDTDGTTQFFAEGSEDSWSDTSDCVDTLFPELNVDVADGELVDDANGDPFKVDEDNHSAAAYLIPVKLDSGKTQDLVLLVECWADPGSDLIVGFSSRSGLIDNYGTDGYGLIQPIIASLPFANSQGDNATPVVRNDATPESSANARSARPSASDAEASPEPSRSRRSGSSARPSASDEASPEPSRSHRSSASARPSANDGTPAAGGAGADENAGTYESQTYGYTLAWKSGNWTVEADNETNPDYPRDYLQLFNVDQTSVLYIEGTDGEWTDTDACVRSLLDEVKVNTRSDATVDDPETGDPYEVSENDRSAAAYTLTQDGTDITVLADCRQDPGSDLIVGFTSISNEVDDYFGVEYPAVEEILNSLEF